MVYGERTRCQSCGREIVQIGGGHRRRTYCDDTCKQRAYLARREQARLSSLRALWAAYLPETQEFLVFLIRHYSEDFARRVASIIDAEKQRQAAEAVVDVSLMRLGEQLGYPALRIKHPLGGHDVILREGRACWLHFADVAEGRLIREAEHIARAIIRGEQSSTLAIHDVSDPNRQPPGA
jgi:hypothetical protein